MSITTSPLTSNPFVEAAKAFHREMRVTKQLKPHLLRSVSAFIAVVHNTEVSIVAAGPRWLQAAPILADCAEWGATWAAEPQSDAVSAEVGRLRLSLAASRHPGAELRALLVLVIALTPIGTAVETQAFSMALDGAGGLRLDLDVADPAATEAFGRAATSLASAFERGDGLSARRAMNELLSFIATEAVA